MPKIYDPDHECEIVSECCGKPLVDDTNVCSMCGEFTGGECTDPECDETEE